MNIRVTHVLAAFSLIAFTGASAYAQSQQQQNPDQKQDKVQYDQKQNQDIQGGKQPEESHRASGRDQGVDPHTKVDESKGAQQQGGASVGAGAETKKEKEKEGASAGASGATSAGATTGAATTGAATTGATAQEPKAQQRQGQRNETMNLSSISADKFIGMKVQDKQGKDIGEIKDVVINLQSGRIHAAVLEFGGILGIGEKQYAFPVSEVQPGKKRNQLMVNVDKKRLENSEGFAQNEWPRMDSDFWGRVTGKDRKQAKAGQQAAPGAGGMMLVRASELDGKEVQAQGGEDIGEVEEVVLDVKGGKLRHVVLDVDDGGKVNVQANQLRAGTDDKLIVAMDKQQLQQQAKQRKDERRPAASTGAGKDPVMREDRARTNTGPTGGSATGGTAR